MTYVATITPTLALLSSAIQTVDQDAGLRRALDKALTQLTTGVSLDFDGTELRVRSASRAELGIIHVTDGRSCTCEGGKHPFCWHRALFRLLLAEAAIERPWALMLAIASQAPANVPVDVADAFDSYEYNMAA